MIHLLASAAIPPTLAKRETMGIANQVDQFMN